MWCVTLVCISLYEHMNFISRVSSAAFHHLRKLSAETKTHSSSPQHAKIKVRFYLFKWSFLGKVSLSWRSYTCVCVCVSDLFAHSQGISLVDLWAMHLQILIDNTLPSLPAVLDWDTNRDSKTMRHTQESTVCTEEMQLWTIWMKHSINAL